jgi:hypothetical protein
MNRLCLLIPPCSTFGANEYTYNRLRLTVG